jgi:uncharacterized RDD family membrane protein YckC
MEDDSTTPQPWLPPRAPGSDPEVSPRPEAPAPYGGPVPPGGWQQPLPKPDTWAGSPLAGWWSRVGAALLDGLILLVPMVLVIGGIVAVAISDDMAGLVVGLVGSLAYVVVLSAYAPLLMARDGDHNGQTLGKQIVGIRVVRDSGAAVDFGYAFVREVVVKWLVFGTIGGFFFIPTVLDWLWPLWDDENRALHDMLVSSHVVES